MTNPRATIAILSIGQMGYGIATLLLAHGFPVVTNVSDRSAATQRRAAQAGISTLQTDVELVARADYVLSIVPPKDTGATAGRVVEALRAAEGRRKDAGKGALWYLDLNAGSPDSVREVYELCAGAGLCFVDGGIIGAPPSRTPDASSGEGQDDAGSWSRPGIPLSGPHKLHEAPVDGERLASVLNTRYLGAEIGKAKALKACFAALTKGFTALAIQSFTTAQSINVLPDLEFYLDAYNPSARERAEKSIVGCTGKAYRWVEEMHQIGQTFSAQGGFGQQANVFREIAGVYQSLADLVEEQGTGGLERAEGVVGKLGGFLREGKGKAGTES